MYNSFHVVSKNLVHIYCEPTVKPFCSGCFESLTGLIATKGLEYIVTLNLSVKLNVINGSPIRINAIVYKSHKPDFVVFELVGTTFRGRPLPNTINQLPILPESDRIRCPYTDQHVTVSQFPIRLGYATIVHKSQGQTLPHDVVSLDGLHKQDRRIYAAFSRISKIKTSKIQFLDTTAAIIPVIHWGFQSFTAVGILIYCGLKTSSIRTHFTTLPSTLCCTYKPRQVFLHET